MDIYQNPLFRKIDDRVVDALLQVYMEWYEAAVGMNIEGVIRELWDRPLQIPCWVFDGIRGTHPSSASQFSQASGSSASPITSSEICEKFSLLKKVLGGDLELGLHTGLYYDGEETEWDQLEYDNFAVYVEAAKAIGCGIGYHPTLFNHGKVQDGHWLTTLSSASAIDRKFFTDHVKATLKIAQETGLQLGRSVLVNIWAIDGFKADPIHRLAPRKLMAESIRHIVRFRETEDLHYVDLAVEFKLTAPETEEYTVGSLEFLQGIAQRHNIRLTLDLGHSYPGRDWADVVSAYEANHTKLAIHVSRGRYSDADLTVTYSTELQRFFTELERCCCAYGTYIGLDTFDSRLDPLEAMVISANSVRAAQVLAKLDPTSALEQCEEKGEEGRKLIGEANAKLLSPALVTAFASRIFDLPDPLETIAKYKSNAEA